MIIECEKAISSTTGEDLGNDSPWLKIGKQYVVYAIRFRNDPPHFLRLEALIESENYNDPRLFDLTQFAVISSKIPSAWVFNYDPEGSMAFMPKSWFYDSFWDDLDEEREKGMELFHKEKELILQEEPEFYKNMNNS